MRSHLLFVLSSALLSCSFSSASAGEPGMPLQELGRAELSWIAGYGEESLSSVLVAGTVLCDACLARGAEYRTSYVRGARVAIRCGSKNKNWRGSSWVHGTTDEYGDFIIDLPSHLHGIPNLEGACAVRVLHVPKGSRCRGINHLRPRRVKLSSVGNRIRLYAAGDIRLRRSDAGAGACSRGRGGVEHALGEGPDQARWV